MSLTSMSWTLLHGYWCSICGPQGEHKRRMFTGICRMMMEKSSKLLQVKTFFRVIVPASKKGRSACVEQENHSVRSSYVKSCRTPTMAFSLKQVCNLQIVCLTLHPDNLHVWGFESGFPKLLFDTRSRAC